MRVCIVLHTDLFHPWPVLRPMREIEVLRALGREVHVVSWIKDEASPLPIYEIRDGVQVHRVKLTPPERPMDRALGYRTISRRFEREIVAQRPDAILCHDLEMLWAAVMAGRSLRVPVLYHAHEDWPAMVSQRSRAEAWAFAYLERRLVRRVDHVYAVNDAFADRYRRWGKPVTVQVGSKTLAEMPHLTEMEKREIRGRYGFDADDLLVGVAGALGKGWALEPIFDAVRPLPARVKLFIVGGFPDKIEAARALVRDRDMEGRVAFTGALPTSDYLRHTAAIDIGLAVFHAMSENLRGVLPLKLFDYMGLGIPAVISDFPAMRRIAIEECGFAVAADPDDPSSIRGAIFDLAEDRERRRAMSLSALRWFREKYCWEKQAELLQGSHPIFRKP